MTYRNLNINQKINAKADTLISYGKENAGKLMKQGKKGWIPCSGAYALKLESDGINSNRNYND